MDPSRVKQLERFQQFRLAHKRGPNTPQLVDHIILAEFDIDSGSTVRHKYPGPVPGYKDDWFAEYMLPEGAHNHSLDWTVMFLNKGRSMLDENWPAAVGAEGEQEQAAAGTVGGAEEGRTGPFLYCINLVRKKDDPTVRRGAVVKAMAVCSQYHFIEMFRPLLIIALDQYYQTPDPDVLKNLFDSLNAQDLSQLPRPTPWERRLMRRGETARYMGLTPVEHLQQKWTHTVSFTHGKQTVQAVIPLHTSPDETLTPSVSLLVNVFGQATMKIFNAVLTGQRVLFVGYNHAAGDVCKLVLAACAMVSPPLEGTLHRCYPYANLSDLSFLEAPGFIAGVTNPMFEAHAEWWDLLCQLDLPNGTGTVLTAEEKQLLDAQKARGPPPPKMPVRVTADQLWYEEDGPFIAKMCAGVNTCMQEQWVRSMFYDYTQNLLDLALDQHTDLAHRMTSIDVLHKLNISNQWRLRQLKKLCHLSKTAADPWRSCGEMVVPGLRLRCNIRRLQMESNMEDHEVREMFQELVTALVTESSLQVLLGLLPESKGGIYTIALGLLHNDARTKQHALTLLRRIEQFDSTRPAVQCMNDFFAMAFIRQSEVTPTP